MKTITVILSGYKRKYTLPEQLESLKAQSYPVTNIVYFVNGHIESSPVDYDLISKFGVHIIECSHNYGVWARFSVALNYDTDFFCILDDDIVPGTDFIKTCIECYDNQPGIYGGHGVRDRLHYDAKYNTHFNHHGWPQLNWNMNGPSAPLQVAYLMNCWFFPKQALYDFWSEDVSDDMTHNRMAGEDIHLSLMALKHSGLKSYVIPANRFTPSKLSNTVGLKYCLEHAVCDDSDIMNKSFEYYKYAVTQGLPVFKMETYTDNDGDFWE